MQDDDADIDLISMFKSCFSNWIILGVLTVVGVLGVSIVMMTAQPEYTARLIVRASQSDKSGGGSLGASSLASQFLGTSSRSDSAIAEYYSTLQSIALVNRLLDRDDFRTLMFPHQWDAKTQSWTYPTGFVESIKESLRSFFDRPIHPIPDKPYDVLAQLSKRMLFEALGSKKILGSYTLEITDKDPDRAVKLLRAIHEEATRLMTESHAELNKQILAGLKELLSGTNEKVLRESLIRRINQMQVEGLTLQNPKDPLLILIDPPAIYTPPKILSLSLGLGGGLVGGFVLGMLINLLRSLRKVRAEDPDRSARTEPVEPTL